MNEDRPDGWGCQVMGCRVIGETYWSTGTGRMVVCGIYAAALRAAKTNKEKK